MWSHILGKAKTVAQHVDPDHILSLTRQTSTDKSIQHAHYNSSLPYGSRYGALEDIPKYKLPEDGIEPNCAYQLIHDELEFDGTPNLNLASFVHTYMVRSISFDFTTATSIPLLFQDNS